VATIEDLVRLVPPPALPIDADGDWSAVEADLGLQLPADYQALVRRYGIGSFGDIDLWTPFDTHSDGVFDLVEHAHGLVDFHAALREVAPEDFPHPLYPESGGLLEWASSPNGDSLCWLTGGRPDSWPVVGWNMRRGVHRYEAGAVELLHGFLSGQREVELLGPAPGVPWFDPYRKRSQVYVDLSEGVLSYEEELRILREVLAPTADRGSFNAFGQRQDHFKAIDRDWLLTYGNAGGHQVWVAFPPEDDEEARLVISDAARAMGCRVVAARMNGQSTWTRGGSA
jgi:hypothetical protein